MRHFCEASHRGDYYEAFDVNSKNFMQKSLGTQRWIAECERLFKRCVTEAAKTPPADLREALGLLMALLRSVDEGNDDIVFWADEGGSYAVGIDWREVLPVWFQALAATTPTRGVCPGGAHRHQGLRFRRPRPSPPAGPDGGEPRPARGLPGGSPPALAGREYTSQP